MAKKNLDNLVIQLAEKISKDSKYRNIVDTYEHVYIVSKKKLLNQLYTQISGYYVKDQDSAKFLTFKEDVLKGSSDTNLRKKLDELLTEYIHNVRQRAETYKSSGIVTGSYSDGLLYGNKFVPSTSKSLPDGGFVSVIKGNNKVSVFGALSTIRKSTTKTITRLLPELRQDVYDTLVQSDYFNKIMSASSDPTHVSNTLKYRTIGISGRASSGRDWYKGGLFEGGHQSGYSVIEQELRNKFILENKNQVSLQEVLKGLPIQVLELGSLRAIVDKNSIYRKQIAIVFEQGTQYNNFQSQKEVQLRALLSKEIAKTVKSLSAEFWANYETSSSINTNITYEVIQAAKKTGAKTSSKIKPKGVNSTPESKPVKLKGKLNRSMSESVLPSNTNPGKIDVKSTSKSREQQAPNWLQLLPMINSRLTDTVARNMGSPRLNFRSGRFAQSAKVVNVEQTPQGFPSFVFDYERDPYGVFDRTLGRSPWNTPQRDPRALVDVSVREIVREMAIGRFFTRRA
jgi:hypothetical protein